VPCGAPTSAPEHVCSQVSPEKNAAAEQVATKYQQDSDPILCIVVDDVWNEVVLV